MSHAGPLGEAQRQEAAPAELAHDLGHGPRDAVPEVQPRSAHLPQPRRNLRVKRGRPTPRSCCGKRVARRSANASPNFHVHLHLHARPDCVALRCISVVTK